MKLASEKQINLIKDLVNKKENAGEIEELFTSTFENYIDKDGNSVWGYIIDSKLASELIEKLLKLNDKNIRPATDKQVFFLIEKQRKAFNGNKKAKEILSRNNLLDQVKISHLDFATASKIISEFYN